MHNAQYSLFTTKTYQNDFLFEDEIKNSNFCKSVPKGLAAAAEARLARRSS
jgi:hypothetical protein